MSPSQMPPDAIICDGHAGPTKKAAGVASASGNAGPSHNCQPACKPGSVWRGSLRDGHSSGARIAPCLEQPTRAAARIALDARVAPNIRAAPIRSCSRWGLPCRLRCRRRGALLPHRFTLACTSCPAPAVSSLWHFPWGRPRRPLAATVDPWSPDFPPPRSMAAKPARAAAAVRPAGRGNKGSLGSEVKGRPRRTRASDHSDLTLRPYLTSGSVGNRPAALRSVHWRGSSNRMSARMQLDPWGPSGG